jgi:peptidase E
MAHSVAGHPITLLGIGGGPMGASEVVHAIIRIGLAKARSRQTDSTQPLRIVSIPSAKFTQATYDEHVAWLTAFCATLGYPAEVEILHPFQQSPRPSRIAAWNMLRKAHVLLMPGGKTDAAIDYWRETDLYGLIEVTVLGGTPIIGHSAGLIAWFTGIYTDTDGYGLAPGEPWQYRLQSRGMAIFKGAACPHANDNARQYTYNHQAYGPGTTRRDAFVWELINRHETGIAVDGDTAIFIEGDVVKVLGTGRVTVHVWRGSKLVELVELEYREGDSFPLQLLG